jgi:hypothetical protein
MQRHTDTTMPVASGSGTPHDQLPPPPQLNHRRRRTYPRPPVVRPWTKTDVRPILPLEQPPAVQALPNLPSAPRQPSFAAQYELSTHLVPGAYPRTYPHLPPPAPGPPGETPKERRVRVQNAVREVVHTRALYEAGNLGAEGSKNPLWCAVNRYVRRDIGSCQRRGITLFFAHASSFPKEVSARS